MRAPDAPAGSLVPAASPGWLSSSQTNKAAASTASATAATRVRMVEPA
jgi:hypothetical protein